MRDCDLELPFGRFGNDLARLGEVFGKGFFNQYMLACADGLQALFGMEVGRGDNYYGSGFDRC